MRSIAVIFALLFSLAVKNLYSCETTCPDLSGVFKKGEESTVLYMDLDNPIKGVSRLELRIKTSKRFRNHDVGFFVYHEGKNRWIARTITKIDISPKSQKLHFIGMEIKPSWRKYGLSRILTKSMILLSRRWNLEFVTSKLKKPALCRIMSELSLEP